MSGPHPMSGTSGIASTLLDSRTPEVTLEQVASGEAVIAPTERNDDANTEAEAQIQQWLIANGFPPTGGADGWYGPETAEALAAFQAAHGLEATGVLDAQTLAALQQGAEGAQASDAAAAGGAGASDPAGTGFTPSTPEQLGVADAAQAVSDLQNVSANNPQLAESLEEPISNAQAQLAEKAEALLTTAIEADGTTASSYGDWESQVDAAVAAQAAAFPNDPVAQEAILERAGYMKSPEYLEERRDAAQAELDAAQDAAEADGTVTQEERAGLAEKDAEVARWNALLEGARAAENSPEPPAGTSAEPGTRQATDAAIEAAVNDDDASTSPNAADHHDAMVNARTDAAVLAEYNALLASGIDPAEARAVMTERYEGDARSLAEAAFRRLEEAGEVEPLRGVDDSDANTGTGGGGGAAPHYQ